MILNSLDDALKLDKPIVLTSLPGDPIHPGHISCIQSMRHAVDEYCRRRNLDLTDYATVCVVNDDQFLINKKGIAFMPLADRLDVIDNIKSGADYVVGFSPSDPNDMTVIEAIRILRPVFFIKGGDRTADETLPEWSICKEVGCKILDHVGSEKRWSSSDYLRHYADFVVSKQFN